MSARVFAAVRPPDDALDHLAAAMTTVGLGPDGGGTGPVRWAARENWHLTLAFYGTVPDGVVDELAAGLAGAARSVEPMTVGLRGAGVFSRRTLWVGLGGQVEAFTRLIEAARVAGEGLTAFEDERVRARPHLTVGRVRDRAAGRSGRAGRSRRHDPWDRGDTGRRGSRGRTGGPDEPDPLAGAVHALALYEGPQWTVQEVLLVRSQPGQGRGGGPLYTDIDRLPLG